MQDLKHVGKVKATGKKVLIAYRTLPGDAYNCLAIATENLLDDQHNALIQLVESPAAQQAFEFHEVLARARFPDGSTMLPTLHVQGKLLKIPTDQVIMTPNFQASVALNELNQIIAEQRGMAVDDLAIKSEVKEAKGVEVQEVATVKDISSSAKTTSGSVNEDVQSVVEAGPTGTPEDQAKFYRSKADKLAKEAAAMRRKAEEIAPTVKKAKEVS